MNIIPIILSILGVFDTTYLTAKHYSGQTVYCPVGKSCDTVLSSEYSVVYGIPIALFGLIFYLTVLVLSVFYLQTNKKLFLKISFILIFFGFLFSVWLSYLQFFVIKAICTYCLLSAINIAILFIISTYNLFFRKN